MSTMMEPGGWECSCGEVNRYRGFVGVVFVELYGIWLE